jgi:hypothetical protein
MPAARAIASLTFDSERTSFLPRYGGDRGRRAGMSPRCYAGPKSLYGVSVVLALLPDADGGKSQLRKNVSAAVTSLASCQKSGLRTTPLQYSRSAIAQPNSGFREDGLQRRTWGPKHQWLPRIDRLSVSARRRFLVRRLTRVDEHRKVLPETTSRFRDQQTCSLDRPGSAMGRLWCLHGPDISGGRISIPRLSKDPGTQIGRSTRSIVPGWQWRTRARALRRLQARWRHTAPARVRQGDEPHSYPLSAACR